MNERIPVRSGMSRILMPDVEDRERRDNTFAIFYVDVIRDRTSISPYRLFVIRDKKNILNAIKRTKSVVAGPPSWVQARSTAVPAGSFNESKLRFSPTDVRRGDRFARRAIISIDDSLSLPERACAYAHTYRRSLFSVNVNIV